MSNILLFLLILSCYANIRPAGASDIGEFFQTFGVKLSSAAQYVKNELLEFYHKIRTFFIGHSHSTHHAMKNRGCGISDHEPTVYDIATVPKIKGGDDALWHTWPWMVALFTNPRHGWSCAGVLINTDTILTAAHCKLNPLNYYTISSIHRHPTFKNCCKNDLAILKLSRHVLYGPKINSVCLPHILLPEVNEKNVVNKTVVIIGWGDSSTSKITNLFKSFTLQQANIQVFDNQHCKKWFPGVFDEKHEFCAGDYQQRADTMSGDSGGPLLIRNSDNRWTVLGVTSYGSATSNKAPGVYVKLSAYKDWIQSYL
ncbi:unnamed protein product [Didymodactylos carnosus]|uniref:Peptidase S1 domain-containing protein n=1 Tax=Didymodactylos carnosus TaxID=1234261 RepID=A0A813XZW7_9BILA|nr:unnamed protein product [Didymodactylos carnosus]CAF0872947.1 unnamed protein product [Didymodactylos carnosus]CAF3653581.1 unnamed protein product [Didymodactylos carnosus]CAF3660142.1 unnamed protein product [Didymodactylos carnosus]